MIYSLSVQFLIHNVILPIDWNNSKQLGTKENHYKEFKRLRHSNLLRVVQKENMFIIII